MHVAACSDPQTGGRTCHVGSSPSALPFVLHMLERGRLDVPVPGQRAHGCVQHLPAAHARPRRDNRVPSRTDDMHQQPPAAAQGARFQIAARPVRPGSCTLMISPSAAAVRV